MQIINSTIADIPVMPELHDIAREYQQAKSLQHWQSFDPVLLKKEIGEKRQWKIMEEGGIACIFMTAYDDPFIWGDKNKDPFIYIHRIVTNPLFRGNHYVLKIIDWAKEYLKRWTNNPYEWIPGAIIQN